MHTVESRKNYREEKETGHSQQSSLKPGFKQLWFNSNNIHVESLCATAEKSPPVPLETPTEVGFIGPEILLSLLTS